jgi:hypothetical protein
MEDFCFSSDGLNCYVLQGDTIHQYTLSVAWDFTSTVAHQANTIDLTSETTGAVSFDITPDDTRFWVTNGTDAWEYAMNRETAPALTSSGYTRRVIRIQELANSPRSLRFGGAGRAIFSGSTRTTSLKCF